MSTARFVLPCASIKEKLQNAWMIMSDNKVTKCVESIMGITRSGWENTSSTMQALQTACRLAKLPRECIAAMYMRCGYTRHPYNPKGTRYLYRCEYKAGVSIIQVQYYL
jgi:hypothetical protein